MATHQILVTLFPGSQPNELLLLMAMLLVHKLRTGVWPHRMEGANGRDVPKVGSFGRVHAKQSGVYCARHKKMISSKFLHSKQCAKDVSKQEMAVKILFLCGKCL